MVKLRKYAHSKRRKSIIDHKVHHVWYQNTRIDVSNENLETKIRNFIFGSGFEPWKDQILGHFAVFDIFEGFAAGFLKLSLSFLNSWINSLKNEV